VVASRLPGSGTASSRGDADPDSAVGPLQVMSFNCGPFNDLEPHALGMTYWFEAAVAGEPYPVAVRFEGRRLGVQGKPTPRDRFSVVGSVDRVIPGSGRIALTTRVANVTPGEWLVTATPVDQARRRTGQAARAARPEGLSGPTRASGTTVFAPVGQVRAPGVRLGAWPALVGIGTVVALAVQGVLAARWQLPVLDLLVVSLIACLVGVVGGKSYYWATHRDEKFNLLTVGMSIQGFVLAAVGTTVLGTILADISVGRALDVTAPGLLFGMSIGRWGCFFGGCCAGRPTASRWGLWSSNRRIGARRVPVQLLESALAGVLGAVATLVVWLAEPRYGGLWFVAAIAAYLVGRQLLFPLREIPRSTAHGRQITLAVASLVLVLDLLVAAVA